MCTYLMLSPILMGFYNYYYYYCVTIFTSQMGSNTQKLPSLIQQCQFYNAIVKFHFRRPWLYTHCNKDHLSESISPTEMLRKGGPIKPRVSHLLQYQKAITVNYLLNDTCLCLLPISCCQSTIFPQKNNPVTVNVFVFLRFFF